MESALNLSLDTHVVMDSVLQSHSLAAFRLHLLQPHPLPVRGRMVRDLAAGVLGFMTLPHRFRDNAVLLPER